VKPIADELANLRALDAHALAERYQERFGRPPRSRHREWLFRKLAYRLQEERFGGLSATAKARLAELVAGIELPTAPPTNANDDGLTVGTVITREWRAQTLRLAITDEGYEYGGKVYRSLSGAAKAATGSHWNGRAFWGVLT
jgi:hypothetical protein